MIQPSTILAIGAHPDDIDYGCLGVLLKWNAPTHSFVCSLGSAGDPTTGKHRAQEATRALKVHGAITVIPTKGVMSTELLIQELTQAIEEIQPDLILTHSLHDTHQEHRVVHHATLAAARDHACWILGYASPSVTPDFNPTVFIEIKEQWPEKLVALTSHESQSTRSYLKRRALLRAHTTAFATRRGQRRTEAFELYWGVT